MDIRRPARPPPSSRRNIFHAPSRRPIHPTNMSTSSLSTVHIPAEEADPKDEMVERNPDGTYLIAAPPTNIKPGQGMRSEIDDEIEQENQMIALYGKPNAHWDQDAVLAEIKAALASSLERKVQSLEHDRWMFEESKARGGN